MESWSHKHRMLLLVTSVIGLLDVGNLAQVDPFNAVSDVHAHNSGEYLSDLCRSPIGLET
jgi:hypothetical protein